MRPYSACGFAILLELESLPTIEMKFHLHPAGTDGLQHLQEFAARDLRRFEHTTHEN